MSEPQHIREILPSVMVDIRDRCEANPDNNEFPEPQNGRIGNILVAIHDFMKTKKSAAKRRRQTWRRPKSTGKDNQREPISAGKLLW